jgi:Protein of unknown function (DUF1292).
MSEDYGNDIITISDEEGNEFELELLDDIEFSGEEYKVFLPVGIGEEDPDYGFVILKIMEEDGEVLFGSVDDDDELNAVYEFYMEKLFLEEGEAEETEE